MATCDNCGYELIIFDKGEFGDNPRFAHGGETPFNQLNHKPEVYINEAEMRELFG